MVWLSRIGGETWRLSRRHFIVGLGLAGVASATVACGIRRPSNGPSPAPSPTMIPVAQATRSASPTAVAPAATPRPVASTTSTPTTETLLWWTTRGDALWLATLRSAADKFVRSHDHMLVEVSGQHVDFGKLVESLAANQGPSVLEPGDFVPLVTRKMARNLDGYLKGSSISESNYVQAMWANGQWKGATYAIPALDHGPELGLVWNASIASSTPPPTAWNDLYAVGKKLTRRGSDGSLQVFGFDPLDGVGSILDTVRDVTGHPWFDPQSQQVSLSSAPYVAFLQQIVAFYGHIGTDTIAAFRQSAPMLTGSRDSAINQGKEVGLIDGYWSVGNVARYEKNSSWQFSYGWVPVMSSGQHVQRMGGRVLVIPSITPQVEGAWKSIEFLASDEVSTLFLGAVGTCAMTNSFASGSAWNAQAGMKFYVESIGQADQLSSRSNNVVSGFAQTKWLQAIADALGGGDISTILKSAEQSIQEELKRLPH